LTRDALTERLDRLIAVTTSERTVDVERLANPRTARREARAAHRDLSRNQGISFASALAQRRAKR